MVLQTLDSLGSLHGYAIASRLEQVSGGALQLNMGTLYPALMRLEQRGLLRGTWGTTDNNRKARFYALTPAGRRQLAKEKQAWDRMAGIIHTLLRSETVRRQEHRHACSSRMAAPSSGNADPPPGRSGARAGARTHLELAAEDAQRRGESLPDATRARPASQRAAYLKPWTSCANSAACHGSTTSARDVRHGLRMLRRSPGFAAVAVFSLALGIGANTAIFSLINTVLLKTLPVDEPQTLFFVDNSGGKSAGSSGPPYPCFERLRDQNRFLSGISAFKETRFKVTIEGNPEEVTRSVRIRQLLRSARRRRNPWPGADCG